MRERGTPQNALPYHRPIIIIGLFNLLCAYLAMSLFVYCMYSPTTVQHGSLIFIALLGTISTSVGIIFSDSISHAIVFVVSIIILQIFTLSEEEKSSNHDGNSIILLSISSTNVISTARIAALIGIFISVVRDSKSHAIAFFGMSVIIKSISSHDNGSTSYPSSNVIATCLILVAALSPSFLFAILTSMYKSINVNNMLLRPMILLQSLCILPLLLSIHQSIMGTTTIIESSNKNKNNYFSTIPIHFIYSITIILLHVYYTNRSHKYGNLLTNKMIIQSLLSGLIILLSIYYIITLNIVNSMTIVLYLLGSTIMILFVTIYGSIADVWYSVGSGQFSMISLDTSGMLLFVLWPSVILALRFVDMYNDTLHNIRNVLLDRYVHFVNNIVVIVGIDDISRGTTTTTTTETSPSLILIIMLTMTIIIGVPLINTLCPLGGYLYSRAYIHGQPNTKKVALCIKYCDLPKKKRKNDDDDDEVTHMNGDVRDEIWKSLQTRQKTTSSGDNNATTTTTAVLNIFVTREDMALYSKEIINIASRGHAIELTLTDALLSDSGIHPFFVDSTPTIHGGKRYCTELQLAHNEYGNLFVNETTVMEKKPSWFLSMSSVGRHPMVLRMANDLAMKVTYWSTIICLTTNDDNRGGGLFSSEKKIALQNNVLDKNGGNIIYITTTPPLLRQGDMTSYNNRLTEAICELIGSIDETFSLETLSNVAKDDAIMVLNTTN